MYRAIHIATEDGLFVASTQVKSRDPEDVADQLAKEFGGYPERILLIENGFGTHVTPTGADDSTSPNVIEDWSHGDDFQKDTDNGD